MRRLPVQNAGQAGHGFCYRRRKAEPKVAERDFSGEKRKERDTRRAVERTACVFFQDLPFDRKAIRLHQVVGEVERIFRTVVADSEGGIESGRGDFPRNEGAQHGETEIEANVVCSVDPCFSLSTPDGSRWRQ